MALTQAEAKSVSKYLSSQFLKAARRDVNGVGIGLAENGHDHAVMVLSEGALSKTKKQEIKDAAAPVLGRALQDDEVRFIPVGRISAH